MEVIKKNENEALFWRHWDAFVTSGSFGPRYMRSAIENFIEMSKSRNLLVAEHSAVFIQNNVPVGGVFLPIEVKNNIRSVSFSSRHTIAPLFVEEFVRKEIFAYVNEIALKEQVDKIMFMIDPMLFDAYPYNFLLAHDYLDNSGLAYLIDLTLEGDLLRHLRKGHRSDIKKILNDRDFVCITVDREHPSYEIHEEYRELHRVDAGRVTRSKASFDSQYKKLLDGNAVLFGLRYKGKAIAYAYYEAFLDKAVYASAASDPTMTQFPLYHVLMWSAMSYFKDNGVRCIEVGQPAAPSAQFDYYPDRKMAEISKFKRGFGGRYANELRGTKYFNQQLFVEEMNGFIERYSQYINMHVQE